MMSASRFRRPRPRRAIVAGVLAVGLGVFAVVSDLDDDGADDDREADATPERPLEREGSAAVDDAVALGITDEPIGYRVTYRVVDGSGGETTEEVVVRRPFASETTIRRGDEVIGTTRSAFARLVTDEEVFAVGPGLAGQDLRLRPALDEALERGWLEPREQRVVAGRRCQVYRAATSVIGGALQPPPDDTESQTEYADACFDERGLLLEEWWVVDGEAIRHRVAVDVDLDAPETLAQEWVDRPPTREIRRGGGSVQKLAEGSIPPGSFFLAERIPAGFEHLGRYSVIPPQAAAFGDTSQRGSIVASVADVWRRGPDLLVVDQGGSLEQQRMFEPDPDNPVVSVDGLGDAELIVGLAGNEVRVLRPAGRFVRVIGTLTHDELLTVARGLVEVEGNELVVDEG